jgi:hypothetical protein
MGGGIVAAPESKWRVVGAVQQGQRHVKTSQPCQDVLRWQLWHGETLIAAVADGAGSARYAEVGANVAVESALETIAESLPRDPVALGPEAVKQLMDNTLLRARRALDLEADKRSVTTRNLATTLLVLIATPSWAAGGQIGDGAIIIGDGNQQWHTLTGPPITEYLNETVFVGSEKARELSQISFWPGPVRHAALMSDGLQMLALKMPGAEPYAPFFKPLFSWLDRADDMGPAQAQLELFLRSPRIAERADDDLSLLVASRVG